MTIADLADEAARLSELLDRGIAALRESAREFADAEHAYRLAHARAYLRSAGTVGEREAQVYVEVGDLRHRRDLADGVRSAAVEAVRARRTQLSAIQSLLSAHKEETALARTAPS